MKKNMNQESVGNGMVKIEKGVEMPQNARSRYPWNQMLVGDSFVINTQSRSSVGARNQTEKRIGTGRKFSSRMEGDHVRVWRVQ